MNKGALSAVVALALFVLSLFSPIVGAVTITYTPDSGGESVSISEKRMGETITNPDYMATLFQKMSGCMTAEEANVYVWDTYQFEWAAEHGFDPDDLQKLYFLPV